ncbi:MAG: GGDEF domain-containing protein, partial [Anaerolineaceae bacterium]|nr:GGDEF domain-containing protein [Anaerolineaceae bacterium]
MNEQLDALTGLYHRAEFLRRLGEALSLAGQKGHNIGVVQVDMDHLLYVNEHYGHVAGDDCLKRIGEALKAVFTGEHFAGRYGGDEFLAVTIGLSAEEVLAKAEELRAAVAGSPLTLTVDGKKIEHTVTVGIGVAVYPADGATVADLLRKAYEAMLRAKEAKSNTVRAYAEAEERDALTGVLKRYALMASFDQAREQADQQRGSVALVSFDVDEFKAINDQFGRYAGDEVLRKVAAVLRANFPVECAVGRYGGDQFVIVMPGSRSETAFVLAEEARRVLADMTVNLQVGELRAGIPIHVSGGVAEYPAD